jgi:hypothetical protein
MVRKYLPGLASPTERVTKIILIGKTVGALKNGKKKLKMDFIVCQLKTFFKKDI